MKKYPFSEVIQDATRQFKKIKTSEYKKNGKFRIVDQGKAPIAGYTDDASLVNSTDLPTLIFGDHTRVFKYIDFPMALGADGAKALRVSSDIGYAPYVYYYLKSVKIKNAGYSRHYKFLKEIEIPIPLKGSRIDFASQKRIAHLLGNVEELIAQRKRNIQGLDDLLKSVFLDMFGDPVRNEKGWEFSELEKFGIIITGNTPPRKNAKNYNSKHIEWIKTDNIFEESLVATHATEYLSEQGAKKARTVTQGAILIACIAGSLESIGKCALVDRKIAFNQQINALQPFEDVDSYFLYYLFKLSKKYVQSRAQGKADSRRTSQVR